MVGIVCRVSTEEQKKNGYSLPLQAERGIKFANSIHQHHEVYSEAASGGSLEERKEWRRLQGDILAGKVKMVWCLSEDRLTRDRVDSAMMKAFLKENGVQLYFDGKRYDYDNPTDELIGGIVSDVSQFFRKYQRMRTIEGVTESINTGNRAVTFLYGYRIDKAGQWSIIDEEAKAIRRMFQLRSKGISVRQVTRQLRAEGYVRFNTSGKHKGKTCRWHHTTVNKCLGNEHYFGYVRNKAGQLIESKTLPAIIDVELWESVQRINRLEHHHNFGHSAAHLVSNVLRCGKCGRPYHFHGYTNAKNPELREDAYLHNDDGPACDQSPKRIKLDWADALSRTGGSHLRQGHRIGAKTIHESIQVNRAPT